MAFACSGGDKDTPHGTVGTGGTMGRGGTFGSAGMGAKSGSGGKGGSSGKGGKAGSGAEGGDGATAGEAGSSGGKGGGSGAPPPGAPSVKITSPLAVEDPNDDNVLIADLVDVLCTVTKSTERRAENVSPESIKLDMLDADGDIVESRPGVPTDKPNEYLAQFITTKVPDNGRISFICSADDVSTPPLTGFAQLDSFIDHGPTIVPVTPPEPINGELYATSVSQALAVEFQVLEAPVVKKGDKGAKVDAVELQVGGTPFSLAKDAGTYTTTVHLDDQSDFPNPPDGEVTVVIKARDAREAESELAYSFLVDGTGPEITILEPGKSDVRTGNVSLVFSVTDEQSGVDPATVVARLGNKPYRYDPDNQQWDHAEGSDLYTFNFDTTQVEDANSQGTLSIYASDKVGNDSETDARFLYFDNKAPIVELDPLPIREKKEMGSFCSAAFDPVGPAAVNDLDVVHEFALFRALVWERAVAGIDQTGVYAAGLDLESVKLFLQPNVEQGLLIDESMDGTCDNLLRKDPETKDPLISLPLTGIPPTGSAWFGEVTNESTNYNAMFPMPDDCGYENQTTEPPKLCPPTNDSDMSRAISWDFDKTIPAIFSAEPEGPFCTGVSWGIGSLVSEGWLCLAAVASDKNGNLGISRPLRVCYDDLQGAEPGCLDPETDPPPSCVVNNCTLPVRFGLAVLKD